MYVTMYDVVPKGKIPLEHWDVRSFELYFDEDPTSEPQLVLDLTDRVAVRVGFKAIPEGLSLNDFLDKLSTQYGGDRGIYERYDYLAFPGELRGIAKTLMEQEGFTTD